MRSSKAWLLIVSVDFPVSGSCLRMPTNNAINNVYHTVNKTDIGLTGYGNSLGLRVRVM